MLALRDRRQYNRNRSCPRKGLTMACSFVSHDDHRTYIDVPNALYEQRGRKRTHTEMEALANDFGLLEL